jgi:hypothetical protein
VLAGLKIEEVPIIQKAVDRGLGEGNLENIRIVGNSFEETYEKFQSAIRKRKGKKNSE